MKTIEKSEATESLASYAGHMEDFPIVVTDNGQPIAALMSVPNADVETISLSTDPAFLSLIARSRTRQEKEEGISSQEMRQRMETLPKD
jgi:HSP20 family molecular chaperone IbpA